MVNGHFLGESYNIVEKTSKIWFEVQKFVHSSVKRWFSEKLKQVVSLAYFIQRWILFDYFGPILDSLSFNP